MNRVGHEPCGRALCRLAVAERLRQPSMTLRVCCVQNGDIDEPYIMI